MASSPNVEEDAFQLPPLDKEEGSTFGWFDRLIFGWRDGMVFDYGDWEARDIAEMMAKDYKARQIENVLALPIVSATYDIKKGKHGGKEHEWLCNFWEHDHLNGGSKTPLDQVILQMTSAFTYKRSYFEKVWTEGKGDFEGQVVYDKLGWRPQTTCRLMRDPHHGGFRGFEQEAYYVGPEITKGHWPIQIPAKRAFVYIHGTRRDPLNGSSDMEIAYWCWKTKQKILFLWFQFLEAVSLPRVVVKANDGAVAQQIARQISRLKSSGIIPVATPSGPTSVGIDALDVSGKGAEQFVQAINWLDSAAAEAVLAGFLNLTGNINASHFGGSYALSKDASDFFLQMEEAKAREMEFSVRKDLFAPLIHHNFGPQGVVPKFKFEPLNDLDKATTVTFLQALLAQPIPNPKVPADFIADLASQVAGYLGLDARKVLSQFEKAGKKAEKLAAGTPLGQAGPPGAPAMGAAVDEAQQMIDPNKLEQAKKLFGA